MAGSVSTSSVQAEEPTKAVIYCRVSSKSQESEGHGLESQETRCRQYASAKGYEVAAIFPDTITGGGDFMNRPGMVALLSFLDAQPNERFVVIFDDLKRFARDREFHFRLRDSFRQRQATVECLNFTFEDTPEGEFIETILAAQGQLERKQNGRQVAQKMQARMESGFWIHTSPIGYRYQTVKGRGKVLIPNPPFDAIIKEAFEGFASGRFGSQAEVTRFFASHPDFPRNSKGSVTHQRTTDILTHPIYAGYICSERYKLNWLKAQHEPLISLETFEAVQQRREGITRAPKRANIGNDFALRGIVTCASCNTPLRSSWSKGYNKRYAYYLCQTKGCAAYGKSIARDKIEGEIGDLVKTLQPTEGLMSIAKAMFHHAWQTRSDQAKEKITSAKEKIKAINTDIDQILGRIMEASNDTVVRAYEDKIAKLEKDKALIREILAKQTPPKDALSEKLELTLQFLSNPWKIWESGHVQAQRLVLKLAFLDRIPYDRKTGPRTPQKALPFKVLEAVTGGEISYGAVGGTRTPTSVTSQRPQRCASTNSATTARPQAW